MWIVLLYKVPQMKPTTLIYWDPPPKNVMRLKEKKWERKIETYLLCFYTIQTWNCGSLEFLFL